MMKKRLKSIFRENDKNKFIILVLLLLIFFSLNLRSFFFIVFSISILTILFILKICNIIRINKISKKITISDLEKIERELKYPLYGYKYGYVLTDNYMIKQGLLVGIIKYNDIVSISKSFLFNNRSISTLLIISTKQNEKYKFIVNNSQFPISTEEHDFKKIIKYKNPKVLCGHRNKKGHRLSKNGKG